MERINVFWTSGLDSTCRITELATIPEIEIHPIYIHDEGRASSKIEMDRIRKMTELIRRNPSTKANLLDTVIVPKRSIEISPELERIDKIIRKRYSLGKQYLWLSAFLEQNDICADLAAESPLVGINAAVNGECRLTTEGSGELREVLVPAPKDCTPEGLAMFSRYRFPKHIWYIYKEDEIAEMKALGYEDVFKLTWFCHRPIFGMPCGHCVPCKTALHDGLGWRIPRISRILYPFVRPFQKLFK